MKHHLRTLDGFFFYHAIMSGTGRRRWTLWHPVVFAQEAHAWFSFQKAAEAAPKSRGCSRRPKRQASIKSKVGGDRLEARRHHATEENGLLGAPFLCRLPGLFTVEKDKVDCLQNGAGFSKRLQRRQHWFSLTILSLPPPACCDFCVKNKIFIANIQA